MDGGRRASEPAPGDTPAPRRTASPDRSGSTGSGDRPTRRSRWSPTAASITPNTAPRRFAPTDHLATEAVAAFVDGELGLSPHLRAARHLAVCAECAAEVDAHTSARAALRRAAGPISTPTDLLGQLAQIPTREIDLRNARESGAAAVPADGRRERGRSRGPLSAPGFPVHRPTRWRNR